MRNKKNIAESVVKALMIAILIALLPIVIVNGTMLFKSIRNPDKVPDFAGTVPFVVLTDSMYPEIKSGDLILTKITPTEQIKTGDVISFYDPGSETGKAIVTHRIVEIVNEDGSIRYKTKGDLNNTEDKDLVPAESVISVHYKTFTGLGNNILALKTPTGILLFVAGPILLMILYQLILAKKAANEREEENRRLAEKLKKLEDEADDYAN